MTTNNEPKHRIHLVANGDSLGLTTTRWACGEPKDGEKGYFGEDGTMHHITCRKCIASKLYREICKQEGIEHPFTTAAKKAWNTMRARGMPRRTKRASERVEVLCEKMAR